MGAKPRHSAGSSIPWWESPAFTASSFYSGSGNSTQDPINYPPNKIHQKAARDFKKNGQLFRKETGELVVAYRYGYFVIRGLEKFSSLFWFL